MNGKKEMGDFQTPMNFAITICQYLNQYMNSKPTAILEPTCGIGNFIGAAQTVFPATKYYGIEINTTYVNHALNYLPEFVQLYNEDLFNFDFTNIKSQTINEQLLILGNPPWVTNSELSRLNSTNVPTKNNYKRFKGLDALTGCANFDICEYMFMRLIQEFENTTTTIALLCKTTVAYNVFQEINRLKISTSHMRLVKFDAKKVFDVHVEACLFIVTLANEKLVNNCCGVYHIENPTQAFYYFGYKQKQFYSKLNNASYDIDGKCEFEWRQGIKHDCAKVAELSKEDNGYLNGLNDKIQLEETLIFPLVKSSHIKSAFITEFKKYVIVTQQCLKHDTAYIEQLAPLTWAYLSNHQSKFDKRKSSIYKNAPTFSMFGIGDYSYSKYKVAISGFYKSPLFSLVTSEKPVMLDDTCYFLSFNNLDDAYVVMLMLNNNLVQEFLKSIVVIDAKRPYTKKFLSRIEFAKIFQYLTLEDLVKTEYQLGLSSKINYEAYKNLQKLGNY
ncbi:MAG: hypothetical protein BEN18_07450 [Epulopiscium sp. Nuni2H_MBin001]|nr:MAG: hypothetical protein BEN18_07450 [Epulopiscium sp. Nuni2H_MBin001]